jgi:hypothetical protein
LTTIPLESGAAGLKPKLQSLGPIRLFPTAESARCRISAEGDLKLINDAQIVRLPEITSFALDQAPPAAAMTDVLP